jgi:uncharacterized phiE125 gp8 family phage protein
VIASRTISRDLTQLPLSIAVCRRHLQQPAYSIADVDDEDDADIGEKLWQAVDRCEQFLGLSLAPREIEAALDQFPRHCDGGPAIELPWGPVREIIEVRVGPGPLGSSAPTSSDALESLEQGTAWTLDDFSRPERIVPVGSWPAVETSTNRIRIRYLAGFDVDSDGSGSGIPPSIRAAILLTLGDLFLNREDTVDKQPYTLPSGAEQLMRPYRTRLGMA